MKTIKQLPSAEELHKRFHFDYETGRVFRRMDPSLVAGGEGYIYYRNSKFEVNIVRAGYRFFRSFTTVEEAKAYRAECFTEMFPTGLEEVVCSVEVNGYSIFSFNGRWKLHRILYSLYHQVDITGTQIDHVDQNKANNSIHNLRVASNSQNNMNRRIQKNNLSGERGVRHVVQFYKGKDYHYWVAEVRGGRRNLSRKSFPYTDDGFKAAVIYVREQRALLFMDYNSTEC